jgi:hypothetical protein
MGRMESGDFYKVTVFDVVFIALILFFSIGAILHSRLGLNRRLPKALEASVYQEGKLFGHPRLDRDREMSLLDGRMSIEIKQGRIRVRKSDCPRKICVNAGWIKTPGQVIACVPNKVLVEVKTAGSPFLDAVVY